MLEEANWPLLDEGNERDEHEHEGAHAECDDNLARRREGFWHHADEVHEQHKQKKREELNPHALITIILTFAIQHTCLLQARASCKVL